MLKQYCKACGLATSYESASPKFCGACSQPFISQNQSPSSNVTLAKPISKARQSVVILNDEELEEQVPQITELAYEVKNKPNTRGVRIGQIMGSGEPEDTGRVGKINHKAKRPKIDPKDFMADAKSQGKSGHIEISG